MNTATTIIKQLGGNRAMTMMGAKNILDNGNGVTFKIGRNAKGVTHITITLDPSDTYSVKMQAVRGASVTTKYEADMIYCGSLASLIECETGLYLSL